MALIPLSIGFVFGTLVVGWVAAQSVVLAVRTGNNRVARRRKFRASNSDFRRKIEVTARAARATKAIPDWEGWRSFRVVAIVDEAHDVKSFYFSPVDGRPLAPFAPGQYLTFRLHPPGSTEPVVRCYSLSDSPHEDYYRCTIKRVPPRDRLGLPPGRGSSMFHDYIHVGDTIDVRAPAGTFMLDTTATEPVVLIGAGIGLTPLVSMLGATIQTGRRRNAHVLLGFRNSHEHPLKEHLTKLAHEHPNVELHVSYSAPLPQDAQYRDYNHEGRITIERIREVLPSNNFHFYLCGPGAMMESLVGDLLDWGVPESHIHFEAFGPASVKRIGKHEHVAPCEVTFAREGCTATWDGTQSSLLEFGEASGIKLPFGCRAGSCGECLTAIQSGDVTALKASGVSVPPGYCLTCISVPNGPVTLDA